MNFFGTPEEEKKLFSKTDPLLGKKNEGYLLVPRVKEFLKLKNGDELPENVEGFQEKFDRFWKNINDIAELCLDILALSIDENGKQYFEQKLYEDIKKKFAKKSSISMIHYFPRKPPEERDEGDIAGDDDEGQNMPSKTHTDTGILTLISCSEVPGLQVENRDNGEFFEVEKIYAETARRDLFVIVGNKIEFFAQSQEPPMYKATVHRVILPYNIERNSMLYFVDVPQ